QAEDGIRDFHVTGVQTCALPISPGPAIATVAARYVALSSHPLPHPKPVDLRADLGDLAHELVTHHHRHGDGGTSPLVPVVDVEIGATDRCSSDPHQHLVGADLGNRHFFHPQARLGLRLHQSLHPITPIWRPTSTNASTIGRA